MSAVSVSWAAPRSAAQRSARLRLVATRRSSAARTPFVALVVVLLLAGLLGLLMLHTVLAQDAFRLHALQAEGRALADREQVLQREVAALQAPDALAARAMALGMVPGGAPAFLRLADGKILGAAVPAAASLALKPEPVRRPGVSPRAGTGAAASPRPRPGAVAQPAPADDGWTVVRPGRPSSGGRP